MFSDSMSLEAKMAVVKNIFNDFGIPVPPYSTLDKLITAEFVDAENSKIIPLLSELTEQSNVTDLAIDLGNLIKEDSNDLQIIATGNALEQHTEDLLALADTANNIDRRTQILANLLEHFMQKIPFCPETDRLLRMLKATHKNLICSLEAKIVANVAENIAEVYNFKDLKRFCGIVKNVMPALIALEQDDYPLEQKINLTMLALRSLAYDLRDKRIQKHVRQIENIFCLAKVALPHLGDKATIESSLQHLGISLGFFATKGLIENGEKYGLTKTEMIQIVYAGKPSHSLPAQDLELLNGTLQNQRYAAICGFLSRIAVDADLPTLQKVCIAGICLASMRQTFYELKTNNLHPGNFSESLGTILIGVGCISNNHALTHIGNSILAGAQTYAGVLAVPGGAAIAIPLAICAVLGKMFLETSKTTQTEVDVPDALNTIMHQILLLHKQMRFEFANMYKLLYAQHEQLMHTIDQGFNNLGNLIQYHHAHVNKEIRNVDQSIKALQWQITEEFKDLYLKYVQDPLEEVEYALNYGSNMTEVLKQSKHNLGLWLWRKAANEKVTRVNCNLEQLPILCSKAGESDAYLNPINRYVNEIYAQNLPLDIPHIPTWLKAAHAYVAISAAYPALQEENEVKLLADIIAIGQKTLNFVQVLANNKQLWQQIAQSKNDIHMQLSSRWVMLKQQIEEEFLQTIQDILEIKTPQSAWLAQTGSSYEQLEAFTPIAVDISELWHTQIKKHLPREFYAAVAKGLGSWHITYHIDKGTNTFADLHIPYGDTLLPNHARDVIFRIAVGFKEAGNSKPHLLLNTWVAYDLRTAKLRMEEYYLNKFKYGLRHKNYNWISLDGMSNQVTGHTNTATHKLVDPDKLALVYQNWLAKAIPINEPVIMQRLQENPLFAAEKGNLLANQECCEVYTEQIMELKERLGAKLHLFMQQRRCEYANILAEDLILRKCLEKLDLYYTIVAVYMRLLNIPFKKHDNILRFNNIIALLQQPDTLNVDVISQLDALFTEEFVLEPPTDQYLYGEFYQKMQAALASLSVLQTQVQVERLTIN